MIEVMGPCLPAGYTPTIGKLHPHRSEPGKLLEESGNGGVLTYLLPEDEQQEGISVLHGFRWNQSGPTTLAVWIIFADQKERVECPRVPFLPYVVDLRLMDQHHWRRLPRD